MNPSAWVEAVLELIWRIGARLALWGLVGYFLYRVRSVIVAIILAAVLTYALLPIVDFLCAYRVRGVTRKFQRFVATLLVFIMLITLVVVLSRAFFVPFQQELVGVVQKLDAGVKQANTMLDSARKWYKALPPDAQRFVESQHFTGVFPSVTNWSTHIVAKTVGYLSGLVEAILIPVLAFYFILDSKSLKREFVALVPKRRFREMLGMLHEVNTIMRSYVIGQIILCVIAGVVVGLILKAFDMQYVLILSVFAGITRAIPVLGPIVSGAAIVLLGIAKAPALGFYLLIAFAVLQFAESKFIMPKLIGYRMQLHPAIVIIVLLIGAEFFGIFGMFMAAPVAAILRVLIRYYFIKPKQLHVWGLQRRKAGEAEAPQEPVSATSSE
ncbi:MAG: AI-2E family transporter [Armatimonadetes bacterium]|nr:AI-2E family transporter [Armatimonadota bacterium]